MKFIINRHRKLVTCLKVLSIIVIWIIVIKALTVQQPDTQDDYTVVYTRTQIPRNESETALSTFDKSLRKIIKCENKIQKAENISTGRFFILKNYVTAAQHFNCYDSITYVTHCDITFIDNVIPLLKRWNGPISLSIYAPGTDFTTALDKIFYLRYCHESSLMVQKLVTFHIFFDESLINTTDISYSPSNCLSSSQKYLKVLKNETFRARNKLSYPINTARNVARAATVTHYMLVSDIELYPSPKFINEFFEMIIYDQKLAEDRNVFVLPTFEIIKDEELPQSKSQLQQLFILNKAQWFHKEICSYCHLIPMADDWLLDTIQRMHVHTIVKRKGKYSYWEPIFVGTNADPFYDERLSWEGKSDKMTQGLIMCLLDYNFNVLSHGFLIHKPGIKSVNEAVRVELEDQNRKIITEMILPEIKFLYGENEKCQMYG